jgi:ubiquinone biosynthesis protein Coq4
MPAARHNFESASSTQTLAQGLQEYFAANPSLKRQDSLLTAEARQFFLSHDIVHVLYGCGTTMPDEAVVKLSSLFGTTGGLQVLRGYTNYETLDIYTKLPLWQTVLALLMAPYLIARTIWRCARQTERWPWVDNQQYMEAPLAEVRSKFRIKVAHAGVA